ncbi:MAG TPA: acetoacetate decarboxylase family protein [Acidimicrobiales bacterium]|nr:acetoacetate decarboxylase family protein [Acidimicrobiales bacterium]
MRDLPEAPWRLSGEALVGLVWAGRDRRPLPDGVGRLPGPTLVGAVSYTSTPVGRYRELFVARPSRLGMRPGLTVTTMVVDSADSRMAGRLSWGLPKELGTLEWSVDGDERVMTWRERGLVLRGTTSAFRLPVIAPVRTMQRRADGAVLVPGRWWGRVSMARVTVETADDDDLAPLAGVHRGLGIRGLGLVMQPARHPLGRLKSLTAPATAPEATA